MEIKKYVDRRLAASALALLLGASALTACTSGQIEAPSIKELREDGKFFDLERPDGTTMVCWEYGARGEGPYGESPSWFSVTCDWDNEYGSELPQVD